MKNTYSESPISGKVDPNNVFQNILSGNAPASFVYQDDICVAFMDIQPVNPGQVVVIPIKPARFLAELDEDISAHLFRIGHRIAKAIRASGFRCEGINFFMADGEMAGQEVFHVHLLVIPRFKNDGFGLKYGENNYKFLPREELDIMAKRISIAMQRT